MIKQENCTVLSLSRALIRLLHKFEGQECFLQNSLQLPHYSSTFIFIYFYDFFQLGKNLFFFFLSFFLSFFFLFFFFFFFFFFLFSFLSCLLLVSLSYFRLKSSNTPLLFLNFHFHLNITLQKKKKRERSPIFKLNFIYIFKFGVFVFVFKYFISNSLTSMLNLLIFVYQYVI